MTLAVTRPQLPKPKPLLEVIDGAFAAWLGDGDFSGWRAFCAALTAAPMSAEEFALYQQCTGRTTAPQKPFTEAYAVVGRRGGKSRIAASIAVYCACHVSWPRTPGETLRVLVVAVSKEQAAITLSYVEALLRSRPALERLIARCGTESIAMCNGIEIVCVANSYRSIRGPTVVCAIFEELAIWYDENSANPDKEVYRAVRPAMLTVPGSMLIGISSPYAKRGLLYEKHRDHHGRDESRVLVWQADTATMNPRVDLEFIAQEYAEDPAGASAEYGANFRDDVSAFLARERIEACVEVGCHERPPVAGVQYRAFCDPAGGSGGDSMTLGIAHRDRDSRSVLDCLREAKPPFPPSQVCAEFAAVLRSYRCSRVVGDRYAGSWPAEALAKHGIAYEPSERNKSQIYVDSIPLINSRRASLLDEAHLIHQLCSLERRAGRGGGRDVVDHPKSPHAHDDLSNAAMGAIVLCGTAASLYSEALKTAIGDAERPHQRQGMAGLIQHIEFYRRLGRPY